MIAVKRFINGISINGYEYLLIKKDGEPMLFKDKEEAIDFLMHHGEVKENLEAYDFEEYSEEK